MTIELLAQYGALGITTGFCIALVWHYQKVLDKANEREEKLVGLVIALTEKATTQQVSMVEKYHTMQGDTLRALKSLKECVLQFLRVP